MKIGLVNNLFEPYTKGGAEKVLKEMALQYIKEGHQVFVITTEPRNRKKSINNITIKEPGKEQEKNTNRIRTYYIPSSYYNLGELNIVYRLFWHISNFYNPSRKKMLEEIISIEKPELVISHNLIGIGFFLNDITRANNINQQHFLHDIQLLHPSGLMIKNKERKVDSPIAKLYQKQTRKYFQYIEKVISPSKWLLKEHQKRYFFQNTETEIRPLRKNIARDSTKKTDGINNNPSLLFVGQVEKHKGILFLIKALRKNSNSNISLVVIGGGKDLERAKKMAKDDKRISFLGKQEAGVVKKEMKKASLLVVPSLCYENSPTVIYEANECGLRVIASNIGGIPEIIKRGDILFEAGNSDEFIRNLESVT